MTSTGFGRMLFEKREEKCDIRLRFQYSSIEGRWLFRDRISSLFED